MQLLMNLKKIIDQASKTIDSIRTLMIEERLKYYNKYKQTLLDYNQTLKQLNDAENVSGKEISMLNRIIDNDKIEKNKLRNDIRNLENTIQEKFKNIDTLIDYIEEIKNISENDKKKVLQAKIHDIIDDNDKLEDFIELYNDIVKEEQDKIYNKLNKFENNMKDDMHNFDKKFMSKKNKLYANLDKLNNDVKKLDKYIKENNNGNGDNGDDGEDKKNKEEKSADMPHLETEEEAAENIVDINEHRKKIKKMILIKKVILIVNIIITVLINMVFIKILMHGMI